jgi:SAM-dependent methyltransferase
MRWMDALLRHKDGNAVDPVTADDLAFGRLYPPDIRILSSLYWTPVAVARRAAHLFRNAGAQHVLDVGSGVGKFAIAAAAVAPDVQFTGIEQRARLVEVARRVAVGLQLPNVDFEVGDATAIEWSAYDGLYFFNPFYENLFEPDERIDMDVELGSSRFFDEVLRVEALLGAAPEGTVMVTYHGLGGRIPTSYELVACEPAHTDSLRLWVKRRRAEEGWFFLEREGKVLRCRFQGARVVMHEHVVPAR